MSSFFPVFYSFDKFKPFYGPFPYGNIFTGLNVNFPMTVTDSQEDKILHQLRKQLKPFKLDFAVTKSIASSL